MLGGGEGRLYFSIFLFATRSSQSALSFLKTVHSPPPGLRFDRASETFFRALRLYQYKRENSLLCLVSPY